MVTTRSPAPANADTTLLPFLTTNPPLLEHARNVLSDICHSIPEVALKATRPDGQASLHEWLAGPASGVTEDIIGFWEQEWVADG